LFVALFVRRPLLPAICTLPKISPGPAESQVSKIGLKNGFKNQKYS